MTIIKGLRFRWINLILKSSGFRIIILLSQVILGIIVFQWLLNKTGQNINQIFSKFSGISPISLVVGIIFFILTVWLRALRFRLFHLSDISRTYLFGIVLFQNAMITLVPWRIGEVSFPILLNNDFKKPIKDSTATIVAIRALDFMIILMILLTGFGKIKYEVPVMAIFLIGLIAGFVLFLLFTFYPPYKFAPVVDEIKVRLNKFLNLRWIIQFLLLSILIFLTSVGQSIFFLEAVALKVAFSDLVLVNAVTLLSAVLPIHPPGGWGTIDSIQVVFLEQLGYPATASVQPILLAHTLYSIIIILGGLVGWLLRKVARTVYQPIPVREWN